MEQRKLLRKSFSTRHQSFSKISKALRFTLIIEAFRRAVILQYFIFMRQWKLFRMNDKLSASQKISSPTENLPRSLSNSHFINFIS